MIMVECLREIKDVAFVIENLFNRWIKKKHTGESKDDIMKDELTSYINLRYIYIYIYTILYIINFVY